jgi:cellulose synthase/poly-beta-1,6-N-acetylglucosamine synthase-like glycosyltransferase
LLKGWKTIYQNRSECYEESPENWAVRIRQIMRWAKGHNQTMYRYTLPVMFNSNTRWMEKLDALLLLGVYFMSPIVFLGWMIAIALFYMGENNLLNGPLALLAVAAYGAVGNSAAFFQICAASYLDRSGNRMRLLPFNFFNFIVSMLAVTQASCGLIIFHRRRIFTWEKTARYRKKASA